MDFVSSFWLYLALCLIKRGFIGNPGSTLNLNYIEQCVFNIVETEIKEDKLKTSDKQKLKNYTSSDQLLYSIIVHFAYNFLTQFYLDYFKPDTPNFGRLLYDFTTSYNQKKTTTPNVFKDHIFIKNIEYEPGREISPIDIEKFTLQAEKQIMTKGDNPDCKECQSYKCKEEKCTARDYTVDQSQGSASQSSSQGSSSQDVDISQGYNYYDMITSLFRTEPRRQKIHYTPGFDTRPSYKDDEDEDDLKVLSTSDILKRLRPQDSSASADSHSKSRNKKKQI